LNTEKKPKLFFFSTCSFGPKQNKNNLETQRGFAPEIEINNIYEEIQGLDFVPGIIEVAQQLSDKYFEKVVESSDKRRECVIRVTTKTALQSKTSSFSDKIQQ
jgi:hypothetical protein